MGNSQFFLLLLLCVAFIQTSVAINVEAPPTASLLNNFKEWLCGGVDDTLCDTSSIPDIWRHVVETVFARTKDLTEEGNLHSTFEYFHTKEELQNEQLQSIIQQAISEYKTGLILQSTNATSSFAPAGKNPYPYFGFIPAKIATIVPDSNNTYTWESRCFYHNVATATTSADGTSVTLNLEIDSVKQHMCADYYLVTTLISPQLKSFFAHGKHSFTIDLKHATEAERWDIHANGLRIFLFNDNPIQIFQDVQTTASLFLEPLTHPHVSDSAVEHNLYFFEHYQGIRPLMRPRNSTLYTIPADYIQSGDFIGIVRLDGLDPMLAWAMGSSTGHTVVALRDEKNALFFCESTTNGAYWPRNGIQCTPYDEWIALAVKADYNVVVVPLRKDLRAKFNATAAWEFFESVHGVDYGYNTLLFGWLDTATSNYPCLPPDFSSRCLTFDLIETAFSYLEKKIPVVKKIFTQAWNHRLGTQGLSVPELVMYAASKNISAVDIPRIPEDDSWLYNTTRFGKPAIAPSQVCCVFVCNIWKAGGVFEEVGNKFNCGEQTNYDLYHLNVFDKESIGDGRPEVCKQQDPDNELCQIAGRFTLHLNDLNQEEMYPHMHEACSSLPPTYDRPKGC